MADGLRRCWVRLLHEGIVISGCILSLKLLRGPTHPLQGFLLSYYIICRSSPSLFFGCRCLSQWDLFCFWDFAVCGRWRYTRIIWCSSIFRWTCSGLVFVASDEVYRMLLRHEVVVSLSRRCWAASALHPWLLRSGTWRGCAHKSCVLNMCLHFFYMCGCSDGYACT